MKLKFKVTLLAIISMLLIKGVACAVCTPPETAIFNIPNSDYFNWMEISRGVCEIEGVVERIPCNQTPEDWTSLIAIQYVSLPDQCKKSSKELRKIMDVVLKETKSNYSGKISWNIIEKNNYDEIYEVIYKSFKDVPSQHEISRAFLTKSGFHRVSFTKKKTEITESEKKYWIKQLKEFSSVVSYQEASKIKCFSLVPMLYEKN